MLRGVLLFIAGMLVGANVVYFLMSRHPPSAGPDSVAPNAEERRESSAVEPVLQDVGPDGTEKSVSKRDRRLRRASTPAENRKQSRALGELGLIVPVRGVTPKDLTNTYEDARGEGRVHEAIDIMAARGTPVLAVADGEVAKLFSSERGGLTIYQFEGSGRYAYYYAHLESYADTVAEGRNVKQGEVIGYVGSSGNASDEAPHLHFGIVELGPERKWWRGTAINPYPALTGESSR